MAIDVQGEQGLSQNSFVPLVLRPLNLSVNPGRGVTQPIITDEDGAMLVRGVGAGFTTLETLDLTDEDYNPAAGEIGPLVVGLNWYYDPDNLEYRRCHGSRESGDFSSGELEALHTVAAKYVEIGELGTWEAQQGNTSRGFLSSAARTSDAERERDNPTSRAGHFIVDVTVVTGSAQITVRIEALDTSTSKWYPLLISNPISTVGTTVLKIGPGYVPVPALTAADNLPLHLRVFVEHLNADSITYSVEANFFP